MNRPVPHDDRAVEVARRLCRVLAATHRLRSDVHGGYGLALVAVQSGLLVWCNGEWFWWRVGWDERRRYPMHTYCRADDLRQTAYRVAFLCARLREGQSRREQTAGDAS
ncbi:hypothetical protein AB0395_45060 [Streptosporangium sp. NPDC051023]|uniref:hypothetical protein n=1 Tax=Streptosporangium sp. NPDC051023 TaxID=3155410 RepID=UPI00344FA6F8